MLLLRRQCRIQAKGVLWMGTPCRSWVALSRAWTRRSIHQPAAPCSKFTWCCQRAYLDEHNYIATVTLHLLVFSWRMGFFYVVDQLHSSLVFRFPPMAWALFQTGAVTVPMPMVAFNGDGPKPLVLKGIGSFCGYISGSA